MALHIYNTLTGQKEPFVPLRPGKLGIYVCGPTVYDMSHIGHARVYVAFDTVVRQLRRFYDVTYVRNYTDIDDKIIKRAASAGEPAQAVSERYIREFSQDMAALGVAPADVEPKVTEHIPEIVSMVDTLVRSNHAYPVDGGGHEGGDVYYSVQSFADYGKLSRRKLEDMEAGARVDVDPKKRNPMDFALWKGGEAQPEVQAAAAPTWSSPWGPGRPGWHIECSAMARKYLGDTFDIHCGGKDLIFPHHENEIAQSEAATGKPFARVWMHNGFVNIDDEKMSKSLGNFFTIREVLDKFDPQTLRFYLLSTHYRSPINFSDRALEEAQGRVKYLYETLARLQANLSEGPATGPYRHAMVEEITRRFDAAMDDDFNTAKALGDLSDVFKLINEILDRPSDPDVDARTLRRIRGELDTVGGVLGLFVDDPRVVLERMETQRQGVRGVDPALVEGLIEARTLARKAKDFTRADEIRNELQAMGIAIKDGPQGTTWEVM